eukprot:SAG22_NODE_194_length_15610_cov_1280.270776_6_plen_157_part_00
MVLVTWDDKPCKCRIQKMDDENFWVYTAKGGPKSKIWLVPREQDAQGEGLCDHRMKSVLEEGGEQPHQHGGVACGKNYAWCGVGKITLGVACFLWEKFRGENSARLRVLVPVCSTGTSTQGTTSTLNVLNLEGCVQLVIGYDCTFSLRSTEILCDR